MRRACQRHAASVAVLLCLALGGCGGGGSSAGGNNFNQPPSSSSDTLTITTSELPGAIAGQPYSGKVQASGGTGALTWSAGQGFPSWAKIDAKSGTITGTVPTNQGGNTALNVTVTDSGSPQQTATTWVPLWIDPLITLQFPPPNGTRYAPYLSQSQILGGMGPFTASLSGAAPPGLSVTVARTSLSLLQIEGTPTQAGSYNFTVQITDSSSPAQKAQLALTISIDTKLTIITAQLPYGIVGRPYDATAVEVNGVPPLTWTRVCCGTDGLTLNSATGELSGTPTSTDNQIELQLRDSSPTPQTASQWIALPIYGALNIQRLSYFPPPAWTVTLGQAFSGSLTADGGVPPLRWSMQSGSLPPGLTLTAAGIIQGTPVQTGTYNFGIQVQDAASPPQVYADPYTITVVPPKPMIVAPLPYNIPEAIVSRAYYAAFSAASGAPPYTWSMSAGTPPPGLTFDSSGVLAGTATTAGTYSFTVQVTDSASQSATTQYALVVRPPRPRNDSIANATFLGNTSPGAAASISPYADPVTTSNPDTDYYKLIGNGGAFVQVGVGRTSQVLVPVLELVDSSGTRFKTCNNPRYMNIPPPIVPDSTPNGYDNDCIDAGVTDPTYAALQFKVPGASGTQTVFYAHVLDFRGDARPDMTYTIETLGVVDPLVVSTTSLAAGSVNRAYSQTLSTTGGTGSVRWALQSGTLPAGLSLSAAGVISGTPTALGQSTFTVQAADSGYVQQSATATLTITIGQPLQVLTASLPQATTGVNYRQVIATSGGTPPLRWSFVAAPWCCVNFDSGVFSGVPERAQGQPLSVTGSVGVMDATGVGAGQSYTLTVVAGPVYISSTSLPNAISGWVYDQFLTAAGGIEPYTLSIVSGGLPPGLTLNSTTGEIHGIPASSGTFTFTAQAVDSSSPAKSGSATLTLVVQAGP